MIQVFSWRLVFERSKDNNFLFTNGEEWEREIFLITAVWKFELLVMVIWKYDQDSEEILQTYKSYEPL
jgi:hypothetical protein